MDERQDDTGLESASTNEVDDGKPDFTDEFRRQFFENITEPHTATGLIGSAVVMYLALAWLVIAPVVEAFWPW